jgi:hypothetical protein
VNECASSSRRSGGAHIAGSDAIRTDVRRVCYVRRLMAVVIQRDDEPSPPRRIVDDYVIIWRARPVVGIALTLSGASPVPEQTGGVVLTSPPASPHTPTFMVFLSSIGGGRTIAASGEVSGRGGIVAFGGVDADRAGDPVLLGSPAGPSPRLPANQGGWAGFGRYDQC